MLISAFARSTGVSVQTVRFYERKGLLRKPPRSSAGYRQYDDGDVESMRTIRTAQRLGFTLQEIRRILALYAQPNERPARAPHARGSQGCVEVLAGMATQKLATLDEKIAALAEIRRELAETLEWFQTSRRVRKR